MSAINIRDYADADGRVRLALVPVDDNVLRARDSADVPDMLQAICPADMLVPQKLLGLDGLEQVYWRGYLCRVLDRLPKRIRLEVPKGLVDEKTTELWVAPDSVLAPAARAYIRGRLRAKIDQALEGRRSNAISA